MRQKFYSDELLEFRDLGIEKCWDAEILGLGMNGWGKRGE